MKPRAPRWRWLSAMLLAGFVAQAAVAATHSSLAVHTGATHEHPAHGEEHGRHDPVSCSFCRIAPAFEHGLFVLPLSLPIDARPLRCGIGVVPPTPDQPPWARPASRAPPSAPSA